jgi:hypothetical protein
MKQSFLRVRDEMSAIWRWWTAQLLEMAVTVLSLAVPGKMTQGIVRFGNTIDIWRLRGKPAQPCFSISADQANQMPRALESEPSLKGLRGRRVWVGLSDTDLLRLDIHVPRAAERELAGLVQLHLERELPIPIDHAVIDYRIADRSAQREWTRVEILVAQQERLQQFRLQLESWQLIPVRWGAMGPTPPLVGNLLPRAIRPAPMRARSSTDRWLVRAAAGLAGALVLTVAAQWLYERWAIGKEVSRLEAASAPIRRVISVLQSQTALADEVSGRLNAADAADLLAALTERTPPDTWAYELTIELPPQKQPQLLFTGFTSDANALAQTLETSPEFDAVAIANVLDDVANGRRQRVQMTFERAATAPDGGE